MADEIAMPSIGDNAPFRPDPEQIAEWLKAEYGELVGDVDGLRQRAVDLPSDVTCEDDVKQYGALVKELRDIKKRIEDHHGHEKAPYLRTGQVVDQFFFTQWSRIEKRNKADKPGIIDVLIARVDAYNQKRLAVEKAAREADERKAREEEAKIRAAAEEAERVAREAAAKAARARNAENIRTAQAAAEAAQRDADRLRAEQDAARAARIDAQGAAAAKPADMVRERHEGGIINSMKQVGYAKVLDRYKLDWQKLAPFFNEDHLNATLNAWAKTMKYTVPMAGAEIGMKDKTDLR